MIDLIDRQAAISAIENAMLSDLYMYEPFGGENAITILEQVPSCQVFLVQDGVKHLIWSGDSGEESPFRIPVAVQGNQILLQSACSLKELFEKER